MKEVINSKQAQIVVEKKGNENEAHIILLHAGIADKRMWSYEESQLCQNYCVIAVDFPGYGESTILNKSINYVKVIEEIIENYSIKKVIFLAASFGGKIAIDFFLIHPEMIEKMILISPAISGWIDSNELIKYEISEGTISDTRSLIKLNFDFWISRGREPYKIKNRKIILKMMEANLLLDDNEIEEISMVENSFHLLENIDKPLLIINGEIDVSDFLDIGSCINQKAKYSQRVIIPNSSHLPNLENPKLVNHYIMEFLNT